MSIERKVDSNNKPEVSKEHNKFNDLWFQSHILERLSRLQKSNEVSKECRGNIDSLSWAIIHEQSQTYAKLNERLTRVNVDQETLLKLDRAEEVLGVQNVLGPDAIVTAELLLGTTGEDVEFDLTHVPDIPYKINIADHLKTPLPIEIYYDPQQSQPAETDIQFAAQNNEMLILRTDKMRFGTINDVASITNLHFVLSKNPLNEKTSVFDKDLNEDYLGLNTIRNAGKIMYTAFSGNDRTERGITDEGDEFLTSWALARKDSVTGIKSSYKSSKLIGQLKSSLEKYNTLLQQNNCKESNGRTVTQICWDTVMYYLTNGEKLLASYYDNSRTYYSGSYTYCMGEFDEKGLKLRNQIQLSRPKHKLNFGICPTR